MKKINLMVKRCTECPYLVVMERRCLLTWMPIDYGIDIQRNCPLDDASDAEVRSEEKLRGIEEYRYAKEIGLAD